MIFKCSGALVIRTVRFTDYGLFKEVFYSDLTYAEDVRMGWKYLHNFKKYDNIGNPKVQIMSVSTKKHRRLSFA